MKVGDAHYKTIWVDEKDDRIIRFIDQCALPHNFTIRGISSVAEMTEAIRTMQVRGAGLLGAAGAFGMYIAAIEALTATHPAQHIEAAATAFKSTRPTAVNLEAAVNRQLTAIAAAADVKDKVDVAVKTALEIAGQDEENCRKIGRNGVVLIEEFSRRKAGASVNILTHCNAGWLAFVDYGSALSPVYEAFDKGIPVHVWVDETRPRNQGAGLTAWELQQHGIPHTVIADNTGGHLMQNGLVDIVLTGADRVTRCGDAANKIGTYLKALAAADNRIPFYVCLPSSTFDWKMKNGLAEIPIESRSEEELRFVSGWLDGDIRSVRIMPEESPVANYAFDVTPSRLITGLITERGICAAAEQAILALYPEYS
ncbi:MAG: hypothetical protein RL213_472 [Bacteroidota bacterium]|jgi:methylthioribose-1-phosphate isomerase